MMAERFDDERFRRALEELGGPTVREIEDWVEAEGVQEPDWEASPEAFKMVEQIYGGQRPRDDAEAAERYYLARAQELVIRWRRSNASAN